MAIAARGDRRRHVLPIDTTVTNQRTLGRTRPIADEDMAVGGAEEVEVFVEAGTTATVVQSETIDRMRA